MAEAIEQWEEKVNRLARHGEEYRLNDTFKKIALKKILVGRILEHFELHNLEKLPFWELLALVKEQAQKRKLEKDVAQGTTGVSAKSQRVKDQEEVPPHQYQVPSFGRPDDESVDLNAAKGKGAGKGKGKGKGKDQKGGKDKSKGKGGQAYLGKGVSAAGAGVSTSPNFTGCFICGGKHYARACPHR